MGQKINSNIFRLGLKNNLQWKTKYIEKNFEESTLYIYNDIKIQNYLNRIFKLNGLIIHNCKHWYSNTNLKLYISYYVIQSNTLMFYDNSTELKLLLDQIIICIKLFVNNKFNVKIDIKTQNLNEKYQNILENTFQKRIEKLRRFKNNPIFKELVYIIILTYVEKTSSKLLANFIAMQFKKIKKRHGFFLFLLKTILLQFLKSKFSHIKGLKLVIKGRFNGALRANTKILKIGEVPIQSINSKIDYTITTAYTKNGTFGIKLWICEK